MTARTIHPFPARMAPNLATDVIGEFRDVGHLTILDPMCGSGTVLKAAVERGHSANGFDLDPLAVLMARVASTAVDTDSLIEWSNQLSLDDYLGPPDFSDEATIKFANFWFGATQQIELASISRAIRAVDDQPLREALQVALSRIIITKSPKASLAADTSHSRPHKVLNESDYDVAAGFMESVRGLGRMLDSRKALVGTSTVSRGDSRDLVGLEDAVVDLTITSPPYLNAIDYLRGHKMSLIWLGYSVADIRSIRAASIGAERAPDRRVATHVEELVGEVADEVDDPDKLPMDILRRYAHDLCSYSAELYRVSKVGASVVSVVGNSTLKGNFIRNDLVTTRALEIAGFDIASSFEREIPATARYLPIGGQGNSSALVNRMRTEVVIQATKTL